MPAVKEGDILYNDGNPLGIRYGQPIMGINSSSNASFIKVDSSGILRTVTSETYYANQFAGNIFDARPSNNRLL